MIVNSVTLTVSEVYCIVRENAYPLNILYSITDIGVDFGVKVGLSKAVTIIFCRIVLRF
jgi:hypothetical protein